MRAYFCWQQNFVSDSEKNEQDRSGFSVELS